MIEITNENKNLLIEWCMQYTDKFITKNVAPIINELLTDKAFITLLKKWKKEKKWYEEFRSRDIYSFLDSKVELSEHVRDFELESYENDLFTYSHSLMTIVINWNN